MRFRRISASVLKLIYVNYPNNPTGQAATREFFEKLVAFAKKNHIIIVQDAAYAAICLDGQKPLSILSIDGAKDIAVEIIRSASLTI